MIEIACVAVVGVTLYCISTEGAWGAANAFLCVLIAALMAMNYFEPLADFLEARIGYHYKNYTDVVALLGLFIGLTFGLRLGSESLAPLYIRLPAIVDQLGKWAFGALTGYLTMAFLLMALHTAPLPREFLGFKPERKNFLGMAPDRQWLGFVQHVTEKPFGWFTFQDLESHQKIPHSFDGKYEKLGRGSSHYPNTIWPSFPIRYAMRRDRIDNNLSTGSTATIPPHVTPSKLAPSPTAPAENVGF